MVLNQSTHRSNGFDQQSRHLGSPTVGPGSDTCDPTGVHSPGEVTEVQKGGIVLAELTLALNSVEPEGPGVA